MRKTDATLLRKHATLLLISIAIASMVIFPYFGIVNADSKTIVVPDDYSSIQDAINNADEGDTIFIKKGTYVENPVVNKSVSLIGECRDSTVIDVTAGLTVLSNHVNITGLTLFDGYRGITVSANSCRISENKITDSQVGIALSSAYGNVVAENTLENIGLSAAIQLSYSYNNLVQYNYISSCTEGIQVREGSSNNTVSDNIVSDCQDVAIRLLGSGVGHRWYGPDGNTITRNNISYSRVGTTVYGSNYNVISNNNYVNNTIEFSANEDYLLTWGGNRSVNTIDKNYWSDYEGIDANGDGVGDNPYVIDEYNQDNHPLINPAQILPPPFHSTRPNATPTPTPPIPTTEKGHYGVDYTVQISILIAAAIAIVLSVLTYKNARAKRDRAIGVDRVGTEYTALEGKWSV
jgi:parallel beta-helix repeat protein